MNVYVKEPRYIQRVIVRVATIQGALEMMRYDSCWPETEEDSRKLAGIANGSAHVPGAPADASLVCFLRAGRTNSGPTLARWASFGCTVIETQSPNRARPKPLPSS